ncbi:MAG: hypothetical protein ACRDUV_17625 [Pseudonocardiaceae bacterium]
MGALVPLKRRVLGLFLAGCYRYGPAHFYGDRAEALAMDAETGGRVPFRWSKRKSDQLAEQVATQARQAGTIRPWDFSGPIELVTVGGETPPATDRHRLGQPAEHDYVCPPAQRRNRLLHRDVMGDPEPLPASLPSPGDFEDDLPRELLRDLGRHVGLIGKLFRRVTGS